jgi:predicted nucleic acid-binding protein
MSALYLETSAILTWLFGEEDANKVISNIKKAKNVVSSVLTLIEVERALIRAEKQKIIKESDCQKLRGLFAKTKSSFIFMEISEEVRKRASLSFPTEPIRTLDAIHLATALIFMKVYPDLKVLSFDKRVLDNSEALGLI